MKSLRKLSPYIKPYWPLLTGSLLLAIPLAALRASPVPMVKYMVDDLLINRDEAKLILLPAIFVGIFLLNFVIRFFHFYLIKIVTAKVNQKIKTDLFKHLMSLSADYFSSNRTGALISRVASDPQYIDSGIAGLNVLVREPINFLLLFSYAFYLNWKLTLFSIVIFPFLAWIFYITGKNLKRYITNIADQNAEMFADLQESFTGFRVIKSFNLERFVSVRYRLRAKEFTKFVLKAAKLQEAAHPMVELLSAFVIAIILYYGGSLVLSNELSAGDLISFFTAFAMMISPLRLLNDVNIKMSQADAAAARICEVFSWKNNVPVAQNPTRIDRFEREIEFKNVSFSYPDEPERTIIQNFDLSLRKGQKVALTGPSGSGKTSIVQLLPRLYDVTEGGIEIDGRDIRDFKPQDLRNLVSVVTQDIFLFNDTIEENIRCGKRNATHEEVLRAAQRAHAIDFVDKLPSGMETRIGDRGQKLSGGEKQRISIARAFLKDAPILILDEATSNLDTASERIVQEALDELLMDRTALIIAHRLSTIQNADLILVLKDGQVVERGSDSELKNLQGIYSALNQSG